MRAPSIGAGSVCCGSSDCSGDSCSDGGCSGSGCYGGGAGSAGASSSVGGNGETSGSMGGAGEEGRDRSTAFPRRRRMAGVREAMMARAPYRIAVSEAQLKVARASADASHGLPRARGHLQPVGSNQVLLARSLARTLAGTKSEQRARHADRDVANSTACRDSHLRGLFSDLTEEPL